jgi:protein lifeguard
LCSFFDKWIVIQSFILTASIVVCLTLYTLQSKRDFSKMGATLFTLLWLLIIAGFVQVFIPFESTINLAISLLGAFVFSLFIVYDTHLLMKKLNPEEYIVAVINLYLDIINLFIEILKILNELKGRD